ncbi:MAG TPA: hypothetical protein DD473_11935 [Planctomycetaceae bacterium]|nr:hypothetical protein [Planctomycetaceae bacterium]|tara:strand:- start:1080 stop:1415 length:336 start_codon:yes stop_codon:yes gene_type:complete
MLSQKSSKIIKFALWQTFSYPFTVLVAWLILYFSCWISSGEEMDYVNLESFFLIAFIPLMLLLMTVGTSSATNWTILFIVLTVILFFNWGISKLLNFACNSLQDALFEKLE